MTFICEYRCDGCPAKADGDLTPPGWTFGNTGDLCPACSKRQKLAEETASQRQSSAREPK